jgi:hypothetical protein
MIITIDDSDARAHPDERRSNCRLYRSDVFETELFEDTFRLPVPHLHDERWGRNFADTNLLVDEVRLIAFGGVQRSFDSRILQVA